jgi:hypothetical protein
MDSERISGERFAWFGKICMVRFVILAQSTYQQPQQFGRAWKAPFQLGLSVSFE